MRNSWLTSFVFSAALLFGVSSVRGQVPGGFTYQGLLEENGVPVQTGNVTLTIILSDASNNQLYTETLQNVSITDGIFNMVIGGASPFPASMDFNSPYFMQVVLQTSSGSTTLQPTEIYASPYAINARMVNGIQASQTPVPGELFPIPIGTGYTGSAKLDPGFLPSGIPNSLLSTQAITTINGINPDSKDNFQINAGVGITIVPGTNEITINTSNGQVTSVSNTDGTLTASPTTGNVVASLALGHANTWTATQTFPATDAQGSALANAINNATTTLINGSKISGDIAGNAANVNGIVNVTHGGTGLSTIPAHSVLIGEGNNSVAVAAPAAAGFVLTSNGTSADPTWQSANGGVLSVSNVASDGTLSISPTTGNVLATLSLGHANTWTATQTFPATDAQGSALANAINNATTILINGSKISGNISGNAANVTGTVAVAHGGTGQTSYTNGQLLIGNTTGNTLSLATLTPGTGISITNGTGSITIAATGAPPTGSAGGDLTGTYPNPTIVNTAGNDIVAALNHATPTSPIDVAAGGTGASTLTSGDLLVGNGTNAVTAGPAWNSGSSTLTGNISGTAATVTTDANLTGPVTSIGNATTITNGAVTYAKIQNETNATLLGNPTGTSAAPSEITLGSGLSFSGNTLTATAGNGTVTSFSSGNLSPLFTTSVATSTTTPALSFTLSTVASANQFFANSGAGSAPAFRSIASTDLPASITSSTTGNAATASALSPGADINGVLFTGASDITVTAAAGTLAGTTLASNVVNSSLTSVGTLTNLTVTNPINGSITGNAATVTTDANLTGPVTSVGNATTITNGAVTYAKIQNETNATLLGNPTGTSAAPSEITLGPGLSFSNDTLISSGGSGTVTSFSSGNLSPLFTTSVATSTTTPALSFTLSTVASANQFFANSGAGSAPAFRSIASTDLPASITSSTTGNAATASALSPGADINGVLFTGASDITVTAAAGTLTGTTLASNVVNSSLTSVGTLTNLTVTNPINGSITGNAATVTTDANLTGPVTSVGNATTITNGAVTYAKIQNETNATLLGNPTGTLASPSEIVLGTGLSFSNDTLISSGGSGTVTSFSSGNLSPLFTTSVATSTSTPALSFTLSTVSGTNQFFANTSNGSAPSFRSIAPADLPIATTTTLGAVEADNTTITISAEGVITAIGAAPSGAAGGDLTGDYPYPTIVDTAGNDIVAALNHATPTSPIDVAAGGTGASTLTSGDLLVGNGTSPVTAGPAWNSGSSTLTGNVSGTASGFTGSLSGDVSGSQTATSVDKIKGNTVPANAAGVLTNNGSGTLSWSAANSGTVTSIGMTVPSFLSVTPSTITTSGTFDVTLSGTALPVANGGTGATTLTSGDLLVGNGTSPVTAGPAWNSGSSTLTGNVSGTASGFTGSLSGDVSGSQTTTSVDKIKGNTVPANAAGVLTNNGSGTLSWSAPNSGTVTSVNATGSQGVSISGVPFTTSGTIAIGLGDITPTSVAATGTVTGSNLSGVNTGDQTITLTGPVTGSGTGTFATTITNGAVTYAKIQNETNATLLGNPTGTLASPSEIVLGTGLSFSNDTLISSGGSGTVTSFSSGNLSPLFTTSVATSTTTPALSFTLSTVSGTNQFFANTSNGSAPSFRSIAPADLPIATTTTLGAVEADNTTITISAEGVITAIGAAPSGAAGGDLTGDYPYPTIADTAGNDIVAALNHATPTSPIDVAAGGTGATTLTSGDLLLGNGTSPVTAGPAWNSGSSTLTGNVSGTASGFTGSLSGDVSGSQTATSVDKIKGNTVPANAAGVLTNNGSGTLSWSAPNSGTVTSVNATGSQGVSISGVPFTTSGTIAIGLGDITPTSVAATGTVTGSNLSGVNTGDQTITLTGPVTGSGTGTFATTITNGAVTYAKIQNENNSTLLGNPASSGSAAPSEIMLGTGLAFSSDTLTVTGVPPSGAAGGDLTGTYPNPTIVNTAGNDIVSALNHAAPSAPIDVAAGGTGTATASGNTVFASPANGSSGPPLFRQLVAADIPDLSGAYLPLAGGTMVGNITMGSNNINGTGSIYATTIVAGTSSATGTVTAGSVSAGSALTAGTNGNAGAKKGQLLLNDGTNPGNTITIQPGALTTSYQLGIPSIVPVTNEYSNNATARMVLIESPSGPGPTAGGQIIFYGPSGSTARLDWMPDQSDSMVTTSVLGNGVPGGTFLTATLTSLGLSGGGHVGRISTSLGQATAYTLPDPGATTATIALRGDITTAVNTAVNGTTGHLAAFTGANTIGNADLTGDVMTSGGVNTAITNSAVTYAKIQNEAHATLLGNPTGTATAPTEIALGSGLSFSNDTLIETGASGTVTAFSSGNLSPLFTTSVATSTTTPALSFSLSTVSSANQFFANTTAGSAPAFRSIAPADLPIATTSALGAVKPDGSSITIDASGVITAVGAPPSGAAGGDLTGSYPYPRIVDTAGNDIVAALNHATPTVPIGVAAGGTGIATIAAHSVLIGEGTGSIAVATPSTSGYVLTSTGSGSDPTWQSPAASSSSVQYNVSTPQTTASSGNDLFNVSYGSVASAPGAMITAAASGGPATGLTVSATGSTQDTGINVYFGQTSANSIGMTINGTTTASTGSIGLYVGSSQDNKPDLAAKLEGISGDIYTGGGLNSTSTAPAYSIQIAGSNSDNTNHSGAAIGVTGTYPNGFLANSTVSGVYGKTSATTVMTVSNVTFGTFTGSFGVRGEATGTALGARLIGVWGQADGASGANTGSIGVEAQGQGETTVGETNMALDLNNGEFAMGRTTDPNTQDTGIIVVSAAASEGPSGEDSIVTSFASASGPQLYEEVLSVGNEYCRTNSIVLVTIQNDPDAGNSTYTAQAIPQSGYFKLILTQNILSGKSSAANPKLKVGYIIVNPSR